MSPASKAILSHDHTLKLKVIVPMTFTGTPLNWVGVNFQPRAAASAAGLSSGWPEMARAEMTLPASSTVTSTTTAPLTRAVFASGGYDGSTRRVAEPCSTPPDLRMTFGGSGFFSSTGGGGGGGGGASVTAPPGMPPGTP